MNKQEAISALNKQIEEDLAEYEPYKNARSTDPDFSPQEYEAAFSFVMRAFSLREVVRQLLSDSAEEQREGMIGAAELMWFRSIGIQLPRDFCVGTRSIAALWVGKMRPTTAQRRKMKERGYEWKPFNGRVAGWCRKIEGV